LGEPDAAVMITRWINDALAVYHARSLQTQVAPVGDKPAGANVTEVTYSGPTAPPAPVCIDVPAVTGTGTVDSTLNCTMGNWANVPTSYAYAWSSGGTDSSYLVTAADAGTSITCVVSATNAGGTTAAPPSNAVVIAGAAADAAKTSDTHTTTTARGHGANERSGDDTKVSRTASSQRTTSRDA